MSRTSNEAYGSRPKPCPSLSLVERDGSSVYPSPSKWWHNLKHFLKVSIVYPINQDMEGAFDNSQRRIQGGTGGTCPPPLASLYSFLNNCAWIRQCNSGLIPGWDHGEAVGMSFWITYITIWIRNIDELSQHSPTSITWLVYATGWKPHFVSIIDRTLLELNLAEIRWCDADGVHSHSAIDYSWEYGESHSISGRLWLFGYNWICRIPSTQERIREWLD